ncbi:MAG: hypothetical protein RR843_11365, partial [Clostridia bacterium]
MTLRMNAHVGVDAEAGSVVSVEATPANMHGLGRTSCFAMTVPSGTAMRAISAKCRPETARFPDVLSILRQFRKSGRFETLLISGSLDNFRATDHHVFRGGQQAWRNLTIRP